MQSDLAPIFMGPPKPASTPPSGIERGTTRHTVPWPTHYNLQAYVLDQQMQLVPLGVPREFGTSEARAGA